MKLSPQQILLGEHHLPELGIRGEDIVYEFLLSQDRDFRFDVMVLGRGKRKPFGVEIDGGQWTGGHRRGKAIDDENDKHNLAVQNGIAYYRFTNAKVDSGEAKEFFAKLLNG